MTSVEQAAMALWKIDHPSQDIAPSMAIPATGNWADYIAKARAALESIREPSEEMLETVYRETRFDDGTALRVWQRMIDAALSERGSDESG